MATLASAFVNEQTGCITKQTHDFAVDRAQTLRLEITLGLWLIELQLRANLLPNY